MTEPINVTPGLEPPRNPYRAASAPPPPRPEEARPEWLAWSWAASRERTFPWLGLLLVLVGAGLLIEFFVPAISAGTLILGAIALVFLAGFVFGRSYFAFIIGSLMAALVIARLIDELEIYTSSGVTALAVAVAFLLIWVVGRNRRHRATWPLWGAAIFGLVGIVEISGRISNMPTLGPLWPVLIIGIGLVVLLNARRAASRR